MKAYRLFIFIAAAALASFALAGCTAEADEGALGGREITITASMADNLASDGEPATRTVLDGTSVLWEPGDEIKVFYGTNGSRFTSTATSSVATSDFSGSLNFVFGVNEGVGGSKVLWALYPYSAAATSDGESVTTTLPSEQVGRAGSFAKGYNMSLAKSGSFNMGFYNVCGGVRFSLTQDGVKEVVFEGRNDEYIAGKVKLAFSDNIPVVSEVVEGEKSITLTAPNGGTFETGKWYYIVALPGTLGSGFKMTFNTDTQYAIRKSSGSVTVKRGIFGSLTDADDGLIYVDKGTEPPVEGVITFTDPAAEFACRAKFDTNGDGKVSIEEAEAAISFSGLFNDWKGVASFDEIVYFKNVHSINGLFNGCNKLTHITIPENITDLGTNAFDGCSSLTSVTLPSNITAIGNYTFQNCSALGSITIPSNVTTIGQYAFSGCTALSSVEIPSGVTSIANCTFVNCSNLTSVDIPSSVTSIGEDAFYGCSSLGSVDLPAGLRTIGQYAFSSCSSLTQISIPDGVTSLGNYVFNSGSKLTTAVLPSGISSIPAYCFLNCSKLESVTVPSGITSVGNKAFAGVKMWKLELPSTITSLGSACFGKIVCVLLPSNSPVSIQSNTFDGVGGIFVPSNLIEMYNAMTNWSNYSSLLHSIDTFRERIFVTSGAADMGTSVKWAAFNVGASSPEEYGDYYAWGEVATKSIYNWSTYFDSVNGSSSNFSKYYNGGGKTVLDPEDDAAHVNWGGKWRIPTDEEWTELIERCIWEWTTYYGVKGRMVSSVATGNVIFLPAAGYRDGTSLYGVGSNGYYWSSSLYSDYSYYAWYVYFYSSYVYRSSDLRYYGRSVRPVSE